MQNGVKIMTVKMTVSNNLQSKDTGYSGIEKHAEHDPNVNHSNKNIDVDRTQFNRYENSIARKKGLEDWQEEKFHDYVEQHDEEQRAKGHPERQYGSVKAFIKRKKKVTGVLTFGSVESTGELLRALCPSDVLCEKRSPEGYTYTTFDLEVHNDPKTGQPMTDPNKYPDEAKRLAKVRAEAGKFYGAVNDALMTVVKNEHWRTKKANGNGKFYLSDYLYFGRAATNLDEGACHVHYELATYGTTRKHKNKKGEIVGGQPTTSLNQALVGLYTAANGKSCSGRVATAWFREHLDKAYIKVLNNRLRKTYGLTEDPVSFQRKTKDDPTTQTGLTEDQFKAQKRLITEAKEQQKKAKAAKQQADAAVSAVREVYKSTVNHPEDDISPLEMTKQVKHAAKSLNDANKQAENNLAALNKQREEQQRALTAAAEHLAEVKKHLAEVTDQVQAELDKKDKLDKELNKRETTLQQQEQQFEKDKQSYNQRLQQRRRNLDSREKAVEQEEEHQQNFTQTFVERFVAYVEEKMPELFKTIENAVRDRIKAEQAKDKSRAAAARQREEEAKQTAVNKALTTKELFDFSAIEQHHDMDNLRPDPDYTKRATEIADVTADAFLDGKKPVEQEREENKQDKQKQKDEGPEL